MHTKKETPYKRSSILRLATEQDLEDQKKKGNISGDIHEYLSEKEAGGANQQQQTQKGETPHHQAKGIHNIILS
jgi:hypothetical protein